MEVDVHGFVFVVLEVGVEGNILRDTLSPQIFLVHVIEDGPFRGLSFLVYGRYETSRRPSFLTSASILEACLEASRKGTLPPGIAHGIFGLHVTEIGLLFLLLLIEEGAY